MIEYRPVRLEDAGKLLAFKKQIYDESPFLSRSSEEYAVDIKGEQASIETILATENALTYLAIENDEIVGCLNIRPYGLSRQKHAASIGVSVKKDYWAQGIGRALMKKAISFFEASALHRLELTVVKDNVRAVDLYKSLGFKEEGLLKDLQQVDGEYYDVVAMAMVKSK